MRHLMNRLALAAMLTALVPAAALASEARVQSLGLQSDYIQDYVNVTHYPSSIVRYQNLVYGDLGIKDVSGGDLPSFTDNDAIPSATSNAARSMGAYLSTWKWLPGTWGVQLNENHNAISPAYGAQYYDRNVNEGITLLWGQKFGDIAIGAELSKASSSGESGAQTIAPYTYSEGTLAIGPLTNARDIMNQINAAVGAADRNSWGLGGGVTFDFGAEGRRHQADLALHYRNSTLKVEDTAAQLLLEDNGNTSLAFNGRVQFALSDNSYLVPVVNWYHMDRGLQFTDGVTPANNTDFDNTVTSINIGVAEEWVLRETDMLVLGLSYNYEKVEQGDPAVFGDPFEATYTNSPTIFGALEVHPASWWHVRFGAGKPIWSKLEVTDTATSTSLTLKDSPFQYALGTGFRLGNRLDLDAVVNQDFAFTGSWGASGNSETPFSQLSLTYRF